MYRHWRRGWRGHLYLSLQVSLKLRLCFGLSVRLSLSLQFGLASSSSSSLLRLIVVHIRCATCGNTVREI